jgi:putative hydrolase of the HAD superfamily
MIKNLLFDLGGVIMDIRRQDCEEAFRNIGMANIADFLGDYGQSGPFAELEDGSINSEQFRAEVRKHIDREVSDAQIDYALNRFLVGIPLHRLQELRNLRKRGYKVFLLSNTNPIMWDNDIDRWFRQEGLSINDYFDGMVTSFEAKCYKPGERIFKHTVEKFNIIPAETLFLDDSAANTAAAAKLGFQTLTVTPGTEFYDLLENTL